MTQGRLQAQEFHERPPGAATCPGAPLRVCGAAGTMRDQALRAGRGPMGRLCESCPHTSPHSVPSPMSDNVTVPVWLPKSVRNKGPMEAVCAPMYPQAVCPLSL